MTLASWTIEGLLCTSALYSAAVTWVSVRFRRRAAGVADPPRPLPAVSILVPLAGAEPGLEVNLAAFCRLASTRPVQLVVGSLDRDDPALAVAQWVARCHPAMDIRIVAGGPDRGPNRKAVLLELLAAAARHDVLVAVDSDVRVGRDYLERLVPCLERPGVGLVTCYYRAPRPHGVAATYEALCINADFGPSVLLATAVGRRDIAFGASLMLRRETLDAVGGFGALVEYLADDHRLAELVLARGQAVAVAPYVVESDPHPAGLGAAVRHQLRWARTTRACAPWGYAANVVTHGTTFALVSTLPFGHPLHRLPLAGAVLALRLVAATAGSRALGTRLGWNAWLVPARDLVASVLWAASFAGDRVEWRGRYYRVRRDGRLVADGACSASRPIGVAGVAASPPPLATTLH